MKAMLPPCLSGKASSCLAAWSFLQQKQECSQLRKKIDAHENYIFPQQHYLKPKVGGSQDRDRACLDSRLPVGF
jgi:hypothetical protein